jgi:hypothetical protein
MMDIFLQKETLRLACSIDKINDEIKWAGAVFHSNVLMENPMGFVVDDLMSSF